MTIVVDELNAGPVIGELLRDSIEVGSPSVIMLKEQITFLLLVKHR